jgi:hypothetical protein
VARQKVSSFFKSATTREATSIDYSEILIEKDTAKIHKFRGKGLGFPSTLTLNA